MHAHFILTGCVFFWPLLGLDPLPGRWPYPARALLMLLSVPFHTVLGLTIMQSTTLLGGDWYPSLHLAWSDPWNDQVVAGGILWAGGEFVSVTMLAVLVVQWVQQSEREARRVDRELDRQEARDARRRGRRRLDRAAGAATRRPGAGSRRPARPARSHGAAMTRPVTPSGTISGQLRRWEPSRAMSDRLYTVLLYSDDPEVRDRMRLAVGTRPAPRPRRSSSSRRPTTPSASGWSTTTRST